MSQTTQIVYKLTSTDIPVVVKGKKIMFGDPIIKQTTEEIDSIDLTKLLKINPKKLDTYLTIKPGREVKKGDVIAVKKGLLKKNQIKAPNNGMLVVLDKEKGIVGIRRQIETQTPIKAWFSGIVVDTQKDAVKFLIDGSVIQLKEGKGKPVNGILKVIDASVSIYDLPTDLKSSIIAIKHAHSDIIAKADALGALAIITESIEQPSFSLPYLLIDKLQDIKQFHQHNVIVFGDEKQLIILNKETNKK